MAKLSTELQEIYRKGYEDPAFFCRYFFPDWFPAHSEIPWFHLGILALLDRRCKFLMKYSEHVRAKIINHFVWKEDQSDPKSPEHPIFYYDQDGVICMEVSRYNLVMMPRGFSKTTLCNAMVIKKIVYKIRNFIAYVSESASHSELQLGTIKTHLETNERLRQVFGEMVPKRSDGLKWTDWFIECLNGTRVLAKGRGGQIRGMAKDAQRPDEIIVDDVEDRESVKTPEQRGKTKTWAYADLMPALPRGDPNATITALGTLLHQDALLMTWLNDPEFNSVVFGAIDKDGDALWDSPYGMTLHDIEVKKTSYARAGQLSSFYREYMSQIRADEDAKFHEAMLHIHPRKIDDTIARAVIIDPAISQKSGADFVSIAVVGITQKGMLHVYDCYAKKGMTPREQVDKYFELKKLWDCTKHGVESIAYQAALIHLLREEMFRKHCYFEIIPITHSQKKEERIEGILQPRYSAGYITHQRRFPELETQLLDWPNGKMDCPDAVAMAITLLDPYAAAAADPENDLGEDEYEPLEEVFDGDWRCSL